MPFHGNRYAANGCVKSISKKAVNPGARRPAGPGPNASVVAIGSISATSSRNIVAPAGSTAAAKSIVRVEVAPTMRRSVVGHRLWRAPWNQGRKPGRQQPSSEVDGEISVSSTLGLLVPGPTLLTLPGTLRFPRARPAGPCTGVRRAGYRRPGGQATRCGYPSRRPGPCAER